MFTLDFISGLIGFILTLLIFSYLINDNPLFRMAVYLFIGAASGYAAAVVWQYLLAPQVSVVIHSEDLGEWLLAAIPLILGVSLLSKLSPKISSLGSVAMALFVGVGAATALGGAVLGTLVPQVGAAIGAVDVQADSGDAFAKFIEGGVMLAGTALTLAYFQFSAGRAPDGTPKRNIVFEGIAGVGRLFIAITFGVLFAGVYMAALTAMIERLNAMADFIRPWIGF